jgi:protein tyrosine phosphatase
MSLIQQLIKHKAESKAPIAVHCSAGIGRTGTLIVLYFLQSLANYQAANSLPIQASVFGTVRSIREQRAGSVQTLEQYEFIYEFFALFLKGQLSSK